MKPTAMIYCQHSLGLGHFVRSLTLAEALTDDFQVVFLNGGPVPDGFVLPETIHFIHLPPLRLGEDGSISGAGNTETLLYARRDIMCAAARTARPALLLVELYPFGRKKFAVEIDPLIDIVRGDGGKIACSVRDILVTERADQARHDERAAIKLNACFDAVIVHADARLFDLSDSFNAATPVTVPILYSGYVARACVRQRSIKPDGMTLVAAGGGAVGHTVYLAAIAAQPQLMAERGWAMTLVAGPLFPEADWDGLVMAAHGVDGLRLRRSVPSMQPLLAESGRFVGQCGYNSALEVLQAGLPSLFIPFARGQESEQTARAQKLNGLGLADWMPEKRLADNTLAKRLMALNAPSVTHTLDLKGARKSAVILRRLVA
jgi:predicted glycosyltransferase